MNASGEIELLKEFASEYRDHLPSRHGPDISRTFQLSWNAAPETAQSVLRAMGELAAVAVPRSLLGGILQLPAASVPRDPVDGHWMNS